MLLEDLADFITRHRPCGRLTGDATEAADEGYLLMAACSCGVRFMRREVASEAGRELVSDLSPDAATGDNHHFSRTFPPVAV